jgi:hypothetical protein
MYVLLALGMWREHRTLKQHQRCWQSGNGVNERGKERIEERRKIGGSEEKRVELNIKKISRTF